MKTNVEVEKTGSENNISLIRRFSRKVQGSGILSKVRSLRFNERPKSDFVKKKKALKRITRRKEIERLIKLGKLPDNRSNY
jgi:ribosomal protein S21